MHAHSHITRAVAAMDSCFGLVRPHQHGIAATPRGSRAEFRRAAWTDEPVCAIVQLSAN